MSLVVRAYQRALVPLAAYYAVTLALPVANGATRSGMAFWNHALVVLLVPLLTVALGGAIHAVYTRSFQSVFRKAMRARLSSGVKFNPNRCPGTGRAFVSGGFQPFGR